MTRHSKRNLVRRWPNLAPATYRRRTEARLAVHQRRMAIIAAQRVGRR